MLFLVLLALFGVFFKNSFFFDEVKTCLPILREPRRLLAKNKSWKKVWTPGNFLTASNSFVLKENNPLIQFQIFLKILLTKTVSVLHPMINFTTFQVSNQTPSNIFFVI